MATDTQTEDQSLRERRLRYRNSLYEFLSRRRVMAAFTILPALLLFVFITLGPIVWAVAAGFYEIPVFVPTWEFVWFDNYVELLTEETFWMTVWRSVVFAGGSTAFQLVVGTGIALLVNRQFRFSNVVQAVVILPYMIPTAVLGFMALWIGNAQWGVLNGVLIELGLLDNPFSWFGNHSTAMLSVILTSSWKFTIFVTIMVLARLQSIPQDHYEAARVAGASSYQVFRDITLPNLKNVIFIVILLRGVWMFNKFDIVYVLTGGGPGDATRTAPIYAYELGFGLTRLGKAAAMSTLLFVFLVAVALVYFRVLEPAEGVRTE
ncbi:MULTISPECIES: carbohydrate ABC transporter permease [Halorussus]|uniref:carbohydrate ABC transporter permease n=1 Tax=Halorussus TaxID=1070314 RepID=UPI000E21A2FC|nr:MULTISPECIES: sugar ABC transporter permease [Halorussus]NHN58595.1 sugar ABC transporter permease [Halorussus sp. JP-T4]